MSRYQGARRRRRSTSPLGLPGEALPGDRDGLAEEAEGDGAQHGALRLDTRLADAGDLLLRPGLRPRSPSARRSGRSSPGRGLGVGRQEADLEAVAAGFAAEDTTLTDWSRKTEYQRRSIGSVSTMVVLPERSRVFLSQSP